MTLVFLNLNINISYGKFQIGLIHKFFCNWLNFYELQAIKSLFTCTSRHRVSLEKKYDILNKHFNICKSRELFDLVS